MHACKPGGLSCRGGQHAGCVGKQAALFLPSRPLLVAYFPTHSRSFLRSDTFLWSPPLFLLLATPSLAILLPPTRLGPLGLIEDRVALPMGLRAPFFSWLPDRLHVASLLAGSDQGPTVQPQDLLHFPHLPPQPWNPLPQPPNPHPLP